MSSVVTLRGLFVALALGSLLATQGCAAVGLSLLSSLASTATGAGVQHTLHGIVYKTFTVPLEGLQKATLITLKRMDFEVTESQANGTGRKTVAQAAGLEIVVELDVLTSRMTRMRVTAKKNWLVYDVSTAREVILQTDRSLLQRASVKGRKQKKAAPAGRAKHRHPHKH